MKSTAGSFLPQRRRLYNFLKRCRKIRERGTQTQKNAIEILNAKDFHYRKIKITTMELLELIKICQKYIYIKLCSAIYGNWNILEYSIKEEHWLCGRACTLIFSCLATLYFGEHDPWGRREKTGRSGYRHKGISFGDDFCCIHQLWKSQVSHELQKPTSMKPMISNILVSPTKPNGNSATPKVYGAGTPWRLFSGTVFFRYKYCPLDSLKMKSDEIFDGPN